MYWLGPFEYKSKKALLDALKSYLQTAPAGVITNRYAIKKLHLLIAMHPDAERKIGVGVDHFKIKRNALGAGNGFWLVRSDGSKDSFSYERCITGVVQSPHGKVCEALRFVLRPQMHAFRDALGLPVQCSVTGVDIVKRKDLHIDHKDRNLVERFFLKLKQFRRIATRYERLARNYQAMLSLGGSRYMAGLIENAL
jgi:hypothetical protein